MDKRNWQIESLRLTLFTPTPPSQENLGWWKAVTGAEPEATASKPAQALYFANGLFSDVNLALNLTPGRVDWLLSAAPNDNTPTPVIGDYAKAKGKFVDLLRDWTGRKPVVVFRVALGVVARLAAEDKIDAYKSISRYLPSLTIDAEHSSELMYQINRPRKSRVVMGLTINRLSKWSILTVGTASIAVGGPIVRTPLATFANLELDINTDLANTEDLAAVTDQLIEEFFGLGEEVMEKGDVR